MHEMIGYREFARRESVDEKLVRVAIRNGRLKATAGKKIDAALVGTPWRFANAAGLSATAARVQKNRADGVRTALRDGETIEAAAERVVATSRAIPEYSVSLAKKMYFEAALKELTCDVESGLVVPVAEVTQIVGEQLATVRTKLLAIPSEHAPRIARCKTAAEVQDVLYGVIVEALSELVGYTAPGSAA